VHFGHAPARSVHRIQRAPQWLDRGRRVTTDGLAPARLEPDDRRCRGTGRSSRRRDLLQRVLQTVRGIEHPEHF
jgi:hypothetical protein